jgi:hypothetical protein
MKLVDIKNEDILKIITEYSDWFFQQDLSELDKISNHEGRHQGYTLPKGCSLEHLEEVVSKDAEHIGYPEKTISVDIASEERVSSEHKKKCRDMATTLCSYLGARNQAVNVYYPPGGFMGWHNNWNASGYNILLSYSKEGNGFFRYRDPITKEVVNMKDSPGWTCKVGYFGKGREPDKVVYHCAGSHEARLTLGFVIPHLEMWQDMIEDISGEDSTSFQ